MSTWYPTQQLSEKAIVSRQRKRRPCATQIQY